MLNRVGVGFVDGSIEILHAEMKEKIRRLIEQKISEWQEDDIYAISLYVFAEEEDPCRPVAVLGYNTERQVQKSTPEASDEQEARWNYAFWLQNEEMCLGRGETAEDIGEWITEQDLWENEDEITPKFVDMLVSIVQEIHASGLLKDKYGREIPILIHELEYDEKIAQQNIDANGEMLDSGFLSFCIPCEQEVQAGPPILQNEILKAERHIASFGDHDFHNDSVIEKKGKKKIFMRLIVAFFVIMAIMILLCWVLMIRRHRTEVFEETPQTTEDFEEETSMSLKQEETELGQIKWQVYIQPDMPEPFMEVLRQYEQFMNADEQDLNDEDVRKKIDLVDGEWRYLYDELCGMWMSAVWNGEEDVIYYSLKDLTGDGYPELVMGYYLSDDMISPQVVYYYSQREGIKTECLGSYYTMTLYEDGIIEYISGGATYTETYIQFQEETESWEMAVSVVVDWDFKTDSVRGYYWGDDVGGNLTDNRPMSEEEYQKIISQYATEPMELEWTPLLLSSEPIVTETVEKNAKNTGEIRISTSITKLWLNEAEEGAAEINALLREIYESAEAEMEAYNQDVLDTYLFENGTLIQDPEECLPCSLEEWLAISAEEYAASIEYMDENYLCLCMSGYQFVAGGAHGFYWSDYYVFNRHTGQRLSLADFVNNSQDEIKEIVEEHILAATPQSMGGQSENALEVNRFFLTAEGFGIHYDVYEIDDYASGSYDFIMPFDLFDMKEDVQLGKTGE